MNLYSLSQCCSFCTVLGCFLLLYLIHNSGSLGPKTLLWRGQFLHSVFLSIGRALSQWMAGSTISTCLSCRCFYVYGWLSWNVFVCCFHYFQFVSSYVLVRLFIMADWAIWASTLLAQHNTFSLVISVFLCIFVSSLIISPNI